MKRSVLRSVAGQFQRFTSLESFSGILLLLCTAVALLWANSPWNASYSDLWHTDISLHVGSFALSHSLVHWINDGLMVIFFFVVGLEIKRELLVGELSSPRQAMLPIIAAVGGMVAPAGIYVFFNGGTDAQSGWGIPMATDIAFAIGILTLVGPRIPLGVKVFLTAFAIVDDLGAVIVIALFYTAELAWMPLAIGAVIVAILVTLNFFNVRHPVPYILLGIALWLAFLESGVHATISGVVLALTIPSVPATDPTSLITRANELLVKLGKTSSQRRRMLSSEQQALVQEIEDECDKVESPLQSLEHGLHPWVSFFIMPVFALANAGVTISAGSVSITHSVGLGIVLGLVLGKLLGISLFSWLSVRMGIASLPAGTSWRHIIGTALLGGVGFTMALFVANLSFDQQFYLDTAKASILVASCLAGIAGFVFLRVSSKEPVRG